MGLSLQEAEESVRVCLQGIGGKPDFLFLTKYLEKKLNKMIYKYLSNLKKQEKYCRTINSGNNSDSANVIAMLKGVEVCNVSCEKEVEANEVENIDVELFVLKSSKDINQVKNVLKGLEALELSLQEVEEELECVYRRLVKTRVSLLNILNN
ncbi:conserved hypothetical protein [Ricinus communis]|uniref:Uncharacterized protein n=1 Tax=Ricinus communis TaxID=3988 RepID=B9SCB0_RICCO|nr:conserved hypothetical protein [Ricinus communis]